MIDIGEIEDGIYFWVSILCKGWTVFYSGGVQSRPKAPCIELNISKIQQMGTTTLSPVNEDGKSYYETEYNLVLELKGFGDVSDKDNRKYPMSSLENVVNFDPIFFNTDDPPDEEDPRHWQFLSDILRRETGLSVVECSPSIDSSGMNDVSFEIRATKTITFSFKYRSELIDIGAFQSGHIEGKFPLGTPFDKKYDIEFKTLTEE